MLDRQRTMIVWDKLDKGELKHEIEWEHGLYILIEKLRVAMRLDEDSDLVFSDILCVVDRHTR